MSTEIRATARLPYGRRRIPRSHRRVMLVLLSAARELSGYPISRAAMVGAGSVYLILARLEGLGWVASEWQDPNPLPPGQGRRRFYQLTPLGRERVLDLLGLKDGSDEGSGMADEGAKTEAAAAGMQIRVTSGREAGLQRLRQEARAAGEAVTEYAQLDGNGVFLVWDSGPDAERRFPLAKRIRSARSAGGLIFRRRMIVVEDWEEVAEP